jgi:hypothetical protein
MARTERHGLSIATAAAMSGLTDAELWQLYVSCGGKRTFEDFHMFLACDARWPDMDVDMVAQALNEHFWREGVATLFPLG